MLNLFIAGLGDSKILCTFVVFEKKKTKMDEFYSSRSKLSRNCRAT